MTIRFDLAKNELLKRTRGVCFEDFLNCDEKDILEDVENINPKYKHQRMFIARIRGYVCMIPYVENGNELFLKTIIPSRKLNKKYGGKNE